MGMMLAKAISPNPSISGLRSLRLPDRPMPSAAIRGTVTVEVVMPPES